MTRPAERPLLFLDVDGPLIPFGTPPGHPRTAASDVPTRTDQGNPLLERLDPGIGARLLALDCDLVWATTWMEKANEVVAPRIGLPPLPVTHWPDTTADTEPDPRGLHWKTRGLVERADGRPFIWIDDEISPMDRLWVAAQHPGPSLLHRVNHTQGLTAPDFATITAWLESIPRG
ncbi:hypothetical protein B6E66_05715 [Streptomyces maremycinicus]|nr:hypothetical protein B6E66_05715 [Streptomyces sp. B9173]